MKKDEIKIGKHYAAKVSGRMATIRIDAESPHGGWDATNITTRKKVRIKSAQRLRHETRAPGKQAAKTDIDKTVEAVEKGDLAKGVAVPTAKAKKPAKATSAAPKAKKATRAKPGGETPKRTSGLDAAATILAEAGEPLGCKEIVERMLAKGLWATKGKTPAATIYSAILREVQKKGADARFRKAERGKFTLAK